MTALTLVCKQCSNSFTPKRPWAEFCSASCRFAYWAVKHPRTELKGKGRAKAVPEVVVVPEAANAVLAVGELESLKARLAVLERRPPVSVLAVSRPSAPETWKHGANCYRNHGCRCELCVAGMRARKR